MWTVCLVLFLHHERTFQVLLAFSLAGRGSERPDIEQARHSFMGQQPEVPDCVEAVARDAISLALWDFERAAFRPGRLPPRADARVRAFFSSSLGYSSGRSAGAEWFSLCSAREGLHYVSGRSALSGVRGATEPSAHELHRLRALVSIGIKAVTHLRNHVHFILHSIHRR